jgi:ribonuclease-3
MPLPEYELVQVSGEAHKQRFEVACKIGDSVSPTKGKGSSRRNAEQQSAEKMLAALAVADQ